jgi:hypothetical protein
MKTTLQAGQAFLDSLTLRAADNKSASKSHVCFVMTAVAMAIEASFPETSQSLCCFHLMIKA